MTGPAPASSLGLLPTDPLVSVVMTTRGGGDAVLAAVRSILEQTYRALELIVVDDGSANGTVEALARLEDPRVRLWRSRRETGPSFCRAFGIGQGIGVFIALQDASEVSTPRRIHEQVRYLLDNPDVKLCHGRGVLVDARRKPLSDPKPALGATLIRRAVFDEIGGYDTARVGADDEFVQRARAFYGGLRVAVLPEVLSYRVHDDGPQPLDVPAVLPAGPLDPEHFERVPTAAERLTATVATHKGRTEALLRVVDDLLPQVDELRVYLNDHDEVPPPLRDRPGLTAFLGSAHAGDLADNGKFYRLDTVRGYHFTVDDDLRYPPDYVQTLKARIDAYGGRVVVGVHGIVIRYDRFESYYDPRSRDVYAYRRVNAEDRPVHLLGTGTLGYHTHGLALDAFDLDSKYMADVLFALQAQRQGVALVCVAHDADWLLDQQVPDDTSIYRTQHRDAAVQSRLVSEARFTLRSPERLLVPTAPASGADRSDRDDRRLEQRVRSLEVRLRQADETVGLLGVGASHADSSGRSAYLADLHYKPEVLRLGPFDHPSLAADLVARLRDDFDLDAVLEDRPVDPARLFVCVTGLGTDAASVALKDGLACKYTRGERYLRLGPFPTQDIAQGVLRSLSEHIDTVGWVLRDGHGPDATRFIAGFAVASDGEGTWLEVHLTVRPRRSDGTRRDGFGGLAAPWCEAEVHQEWLRLVHEARVAGAAGRHAKALRGYATARAIQPLGAEDLHGLGVCLVRTNSLAAGIEALVEAAASGAPIDAVADSLAAALGASAPRHRVDIYADLLARRPGALRLRRDLAAALVEARQPEGALGLFERPAGPVDPLEWERAGYHVARRAGHHRRALGFLARGIGRRLQQWLRPGAVAAEDLLLPAPLVPVDAPAPSNPEVGRSRWRAPDERALRELSNLVHAASDAPVGTAPAATPSAEAPPAAPEPLREDVAWMQERLDSADLVHRELKWELEELTSRLADEEAQRLKTTQEAETLRAALEAARAEGEASRNALIVASSEREIAEALLRDASSRHAGTSPAEAHGDLRVACLLDEFSYASYRPECNALRLTPQWWRQELEAFQPELLLVESAWRGKDDLWGGKVAHRSDELVGVVAWCRERGIPTVFWNKEDPVHYGTFLNTAKLFDHVFTTDIDCIHRYKRALGHDRVYLLPFACQPRLTNPIESYDRKDAFCFAGAYYVRYPERTRDLENFVSTLAAFRPVEIYDRNHGKSDPNYQFPPEFQPFIVGSLPFDQIDRAYKGYRYAINLNSIKQSQSMFARRVFELLASNTVTISNFSRGVRLFFGDLVVTTDSGPEIVRRIEALADDVTLRKFRLAGLRKVMREHTYRDRFAYLLGKVRGAAPAEALPPVVVTGFAKDPEQFAALVERFTRQTWPSKRLVVLVPKGFPRRAHPKGGPIEVVTAKAAGHARIGDLLAPGEWLASLSAADHYGPNFLLDLALATRYSAARAFGKVARFAWSEASRSVDLAADGQQYRPASSVLARAALVHRDLVADLLLADWLADLETRRLDGVDALALDEFNYCEGGGAAGFEPEHAAAVDDLARLDSGLPLAEVLRRAEAIEAEDVVEEGVPVLTGAELAGYFTNAKDPAIRSTVDGTGWVLESSLEQGKHTYLYSAKDLRPEELGFSAEARFHLDAAPGLDVRIGLLFLGVGGKPVGRALGTANSDNRAELPPGTVGVRLAIGIHGAGATGIHSLVFGSRSVRLREQLGKSDDLVPAHLYPSHDACRPTILVFTNLGVNTIDGSSIFITNWLNLFCLLDAEVHFLSTIEPGEHFLGRLTDPNRPVFHRCDTDSVVAAIQLLDVKYHYSRIFIRSWGPKALWYSPTYASKVSFYWPLTSEPSHEDRMVYGTVGSVVYQTADLREATVSVLGNKDSVLMQPIVDIATLDAQPPVPDRNFKARMTFGYVGTLRAECFSKNLLQVMLDTVEANSDVLFYLIIGKVHYTNYEAKREVLALVEALRGRPNTIVHERLDKAVCDAVLARCDVSFSLWEQTPANELQVSTKLLESLSLGCHVITFNTAKHRQLLGHDYLGLIHDIADLGRAVDRYLRVGKVGMTRFVDGHTLSQFSLERQAMTIARHVGAPVTNALEHQRRLFHKQYDEIYGVFIDESEELKLRALCERHQIRMRLFRGTFGKEELVHEFAEYQKRGLRTPWERAAKKQRLSIGAMGHLYTFIRIAEDALARGLKKILILEADVILHREFFARHAQMNLEDYRLLYLGAGMWRSEVEFTDTGMFYRPNQTTGTFAIALDASVLEECIVLWRQLVDPTDVALWHIQEKYRNECFVASPNLVICDLTRSNTGHKRDQKELSARFAWRLADYDIAFTDRVDRYVEMMRIRIAHLEPNANLRLHCARGVIDIPCDSSAVEIRVGDHLHRIEHENLFIDSVEFS